MQTLIHVTALSHVSLSFPWPRGDIGGAGGGLLLLGAPPESLRRPCLSHAYCALGPGPEARPVQRVQERDVGAGWWNSPSLRPLLLPCEHPCPPAHAPLLGGPPGLPRLDSQPKRLLYLPWELLGGVEATSTQVSLPQGSPP